MRYRKVISDTVSGDSRVPSWPCRVFEVEKDAVTGEETSKEVEAHCVFGPNGEAVAGMIERIQSFTEDDIARLAPGILGREEAVGRAFDMLRMNSWMSMALHTAERAALEGLRAPLSSVVPKIVAVAAGRPPEGASEPLLEAGSAFRAVLHREEYAEVFVDPQPHLWEVEAGAVLRSVLLGGIEGAVKAVVVQRLMPEDHYRVLVGSWEAVFGPVFANAND